MYTLNPKALEIAKQMAIVAGILVEGPSHLVFTYDQIAQTGILDRFAWEEGQSVSIDSRGGLGIKGRLRLGGYFDPEIPDRERCLYFEAQFSWPDYNNKSKMALRVFRIGKEAKTFGLTLTLLFTDTGPEVVTLRKSRGFGGPGVGIIEFQKTIMSIPSIRENIEILAKRRRNEFAQVLARR